MPVFHWDAPEGRGIVDRRFWIYLVVTVPLTALTLILLAVWMSLSDRTSEGGQSVREYVRGAGLKDYVRRKVSNFSATGKQNQNPSLPGP